MVGPEDIEEKEVVIIVMTSHGAPSFFVRRIEAEVAFEADLRARSRGWRGTSRFMVLFSFADWIV